METATGQQEMLDMRTKNCQVWVELIHCYFLLHGFLTITTSYFALFRTRIHKLGLWWPLFDLLVVNISFQVKWNQFLQLSQTTASVLVNHSFLYKIINIMLKDIGQLLVLAFLAKGTWIRESLATFWFFSRLKKQPPGQRLKVGSSFICFLVDY